MIEIVGANEGQEYEAAVHLRKLILAVTCPHCEGHL